MLQRSFEDLHSSKIFVRKFIFVFIFTKYQNFNVYDYHWFLKIPNSLSFDFGPFSIIVATLFLLLLICESKYSSTHKSWIFCFAQLLLQIFVNYQNQEHIWKLLVLMFSKHPLHVQFDQVLAEIFEVKDTWYHCLFYFHDNWFDWEENCWDLNILC